MPRPVYIICSESRSIDQTSSMMSLFNVLEGYHLMVMEDHVQSVKVSLKDLHRFSTAPVIMCTTVWMLNEVDDAGGEYEYELNTQAPGELKQVKASGTFKFEKKFHRFLSTILIDKPVKQSGIFLIENRIRPVDTGESEWLAQDYPLPITVTASPKPDDKKAISEQGLT